MTVQSDKWPKVQGLPVGNWPVLVDLGVRGWVGAVWEGGGEPLSVLHHAVCLTQS